MKLLFKPLADMGDDGIIHIIQREQDRLETISDYGYEDLVPLTATDWWQFAPWQEMETAELMTMIIVINNDGVFTMTMLHDDKQRAAYKKWLPLPTAEK